MAKQRWNPRGPKCEVCGAVMSPKDEGGEPVCWHEKNHPGILRKQAEDATRRGETRRNKKR